eukprot:Rhum_TRINITY_DN13940_c0_g1::Rhum_TRINITY_DN13940_c0_g1_i1::g.66100::m.66100/K17816/NUDT1, MTH1; 8-oxo-dGTP diphosphatase / 2-hydroxy-dATP diphosphatase
MPVADLPQPLLHSAFDEPSVFHAGKRVYTEVFICDDAGGARSQRRVLLGRKKRGFKAGLWFGYGGKVEATDETVEAAACRELEEEACVRLDAAALVPVGRLHVQFNEPARKYLEIHAFRVDAALPDVRAALAALAETDEMSPAWYDECDVPWGSCLPDVRAWYPHAFAGTAFDAQFVLGAGDACLHAQVDTR